MPISHGHKPYQYNDYVASMEANDLIKAVEVKQNLYDEGVAQVDAKLHELAGVDIAREQDREYLNQELKKIYQIAQSKASKDFSNPQMLKSFLDIAKPLENDVRFKNAKESTIELRNRQKTLAEVRAKNPKLYSAANEREYMRDLEDWQNNPNAGARLEHKEYVPYKDISEKVMKILKEMKPDTDMTMSDVGKWLSQDTVKGLSADKIKNAILSQLSADEIHQLQIDANFESENTDPRTKFNTVATALQGTIQQNEEFARIRDVKNLTGYTKEQHAQMALAAREQLKLLNNPKELDIMYANAHIANFVDGIGKAYSYRDIQQKIQANPYTFMHAKAAEDLKKAKQEHIFRMEEIDNRNEGMYNTASLKKGASGIVESDEGQLRYLYGDKDPVKAVPGVEYQIPFTSTPTEDGGFTQGRAMYKAEEILKSIDVANNPHYNTGKWFDEDGNLDKGVALSYSTDAKGNVTYQLTAKNKDSKKEHLKIEIPAEGMAQFVGDQSSTQEDSGESVNVDMDQTQLELYKYLYGE